MRGSKFFLAGMVFLCLSLGNVTTGCGGDEEVVIIDICGQALDAMNSVGCEETAYARVDGLKVCVMACGAGEDECIQEKCLDNPDVGFTGCSGEIQVLFSGTCGTCYANCAFDFIGDEINPGCLFGDATGTECLTDLYDCVNDDC